MTRNSEQILRIAVVCDNPNFSPSSRNFKIIPACEKKSSHRKVSKHFRVKITFERTFSYNFLFLRKQIFVQTRHSFRRQWKGNCMYVCGLTLILPVMWQNPPARLPLMPRKRKPRDAKAQQHDTSRPLYVMYVNTAFEKSMCCKNGTYIWSALLNCLLSIKIKKKLFLYAR